MRSFLLTTCFVFLSLSRTVLGQNDIDNKLIFSPYKDTSINMDWNTYVISTKISKDGETPAPHSFLESLLPENENVTLAFATGECGQESWGGVPAQTLIDSNLSKFVQNNTNYIISTGGAAGAFTCSSPEKFKAFFEKYNTERLIGIDFDIEGGYTQSQVTDLIKNAAVVQNEVHIPISLTLATLGTSDPVDPLNVYGHWAIEAAKESGLTFTVNLMVMDYGSANCQKDANGICDMGASAVNAANAVSREYAIPLSRIELTPMIGVNDQTDEITGIDDIKTMVQFAKTNHLAGLHYWAFDRDISCPGSTVVASPTCHGQNELPLAYDQAFLNALND